MPHALYRPLLSKMEIDGRHTTEKIWSLTMEIIYLLSGETPVKSGDHVAITVSPAQSLSLERRTMLKILEVTNKITKLLTGEVPIRCQDVAVYLSIEEWEFLEEHQELYKDDEEDRPLPPLPGHSNTPNKYPLVHSPNDVQEYHMIPHYQTEIGEVFIEESGQIAAGIDLYQDINMESSSWQVTPESSHLGDDGDGHAYIRSDEHYKEEESSLQIDAVGRYTREEDITTDYPLGNGITRELYSNSYGVEPSSNLSGHWVCDPDDSYPPIYSSERKINLSPEKPNRGEAVFSSRMWENVSYEITHKRVPIGEKPYSCSNCGKCFPRKKDLSIHERIHTGEKPYSCSKCEKCFSRKKDLDIHERVHTGERPYLCSECGKCFSQKSILTTHMSVHSGVKPYSCSGCGKCFSKKANLIAHERVHTGEKPFPCSVCGKYFATKSTLIAHKRLHTGEKPYSCSECGKCFATKSDFIKHARVHTGEKPYPCSKCGKCFSQSSQLIKHAKVHTRDKPQC